MKLLILLSYVTLPVLIILISAVIPLFFAIARKTKGRNAFRIFTALLSGFIIINSLSALYISKNPVFIYRNDSEEYVSGYMKDEIKSSAVDLYHAGLLFPAVVEVMHASEEYVSVRIYYLPYGNAEFNINFAENIKNISKPLY
jgi:hypothetical protein